MYITVNLLAVKSSTTALLLAVWGISVFATAFLLAGYCTIVSCQLTNMQLSLFKVTNHSHTLYISMRACKERSTASLYGETVSPNEYYVNQPPREHSLFYSIPHYFRENGIKRLKTDTKRMATIK